ncbi:MAG TPA: ankyrin repeat domain-containing protein [Gammaproteobacteria bacterium]|jgi:hypothetical protein|nr:ankyrin repeat domain-containing protein [Gammaproteobacteria bacterium]
MTISRETFLKELTDYAFLKEQIELAVERADDKYLKKILDNLPTTFDINFKTKEGHTLLILCAKNKNYEKCTQLLINANADLTATSRDGYTALDYHSQKYYNKFFVKQKLESKNNQDYSYSPQHKKIRGDKNN